MVSKIETRISCIDNNLPLNLCFMMFSGIKRNNPPQSSPITEPAAKRQQTTNSVLRSHLCNLVLDILRSTFEAANGSVVPVGPFQNGSPAALPTFSTLPFDVLREVVSFFDPYSQNNSALVNKELKGLVRERQHALTLLGQELSRALAE